MGIARRPLELESPDPSTLAEPPAATALATRPLQSIHHRLFRSLHSNRLLYNTCWEDPRIDRRLFQIQPGSRVLVITSAGCNALDYLLDDPAEVVAVDINPRQNALLELKLALIRRGDYEDLFAVFGRGCHPDFPRLLAAVRDDLPAYALEFWGQRLGYFSGTPLRRSFYYHGVAGAIAWLMRKLLLGLNQRLRQAVFDLLEARSLREQAWAYDQVESCLFGRLTRAMLRQPTVLAMLGVHQAQLGLIERDFPGGVADYLGEKLRRVFTEIPTCENYFWRVYITGSYTRTCCPNYLKEENFPVLRSRLDRVRVVTSPLTEFLGRETRPFTHLALLDHQDWLAGHDFAALEEEWRTLVRRSIRGTRILIRSAGEVLDFLPVWLQGKIGFYPEQTVPLHRLDRVGTYGSLHLAEVL